MSNVLLIVIKKIGKKFMNKDVLDTQAFLKTYSKDDCYLFNSIASSMKDRKRDNTLL